MRTRLTEMFGIEYPIVAFSHCRDVVAAVSKAGGLGVFGAGSSLSPDELDLELRWIDEHVGDRPYGLDVIMPESISGGDLEVLAKQIPQGHRDFVAGLVERFHIPPPKPSGKSMRFNPNAGSPELSRQLVDVAFRHKTRLVVSALGVPPPELVEEAHRRGVIVAALVGEVKHAKKQAAAGVDIVVAVGSEGGGHVGTKVSTMVLVPAVVDAVAPLPVLAAGGIGTGRGVAAALALGAEGVWTGSVWLATVESNVDSIIKEKLLRAGAADTAIARWKSGKTQRWLRTPWVDAWNEPGAPPPLPRALQTLLVRDAEIGMLEHRVAEVMTTPAGQVVELVTQVRKCRDVVSEMALGCIDATVRMAEIAGVTE